MYAIGFCKVLLLACASTLLIQDGEASMEGEVSPSGKYIASIVNEAGLRSTVIIRNAASSRQLRRKRIAPFASDKLVTRNLKSVFWGVDDRRLYLVGECADTSWCLLYFDIFRNKIGRIVESAEEWQLLRTGKYKGYLVVKLRKFTLTRLWNWYWLIFSGGEIVGPIGDSEDLGEFLSRQ